MADSGRHDGAYDFHREPDRRQTESGSDIFQIGITLIMSGYDNLTPEGWAFYIIWSRLTLMGIM
jgi:hypothetical protein